MQYSVFRNPCLRFYSLMFFFIAETGCHEELPPYDNPQNILEGTVGTIYSFSQTENALKVLLTVTNNYDETLEAKALLQGRGMIRLKRDTSIHKSFAWSPARLVGSPKYNSATGVLTIDPGTSIELIYTWNFVDDSGTDLRQNVFSYHPDSSCDDRMISFPETFILSSGIRVFEQLAETKAKEQEERFCHVNTWVNPLVCPMPQLSCSE